MSNASTRRRYRPHARPYRERDIEVIPGVTVSPGGFGLLVDAVRRHYYANGPVPHRSRMADLIRALEAREYICPHVAAAIIQPAAPIPARTTPAGRPDHPEPLPCSPK